MRSARATADPGLLGLFEASAQNVEDTARLLHALLADYPEQAALAADIVRCEHDGDRIAHDIKAQLARHGTGGVLEPADVHALAGALDDIVDHAEEAADQLALYAVEAPMEPAQRMAEILTALGEEQRSEEFAARAGELKRRRHDAFWMPEDGFYAMALDPDKQQVRSIASNPGHALASGLVPREHARACADRLMAADLFSSPHVTVVGAAENSANRR